MEGQIDLESGLYTAARQTSLKSSSISYEVKKNGEWTAVEDQGLLSIPELARSGTIVTFWNETIPEPLAVVELSADSEPATVQFKASAYAGRQMIAHSPRGADIIVHPNPTFGFVRFDLVNLSLIHI